MELRSSWPAVVRSIHQHRHYRLAGALDVKPTPIDITQIDEAFLWLALLDDDRRRTIVACRTAGMSWRAVCASKAVWASNRAPKMVRASKMVKLSPSSGWARREMRAGLNEIATRLNTTSR